MWLLDLLPTGMLFRGLLHFIVQLSVPTVCWQIMYFPCSEVPLSSWITTLPTRLLTPSFQQKLIWPWGKSSQCWLRSGTSSKYPIVLSVHRILLLPLCLSFSRGLSFSLPLTPTPHFTTAMNSTLTPICSSLQMNVQLQEGGFHNMVIVNSGHLYGWVHDPHSQIQ